MLVLPRANFLNGSHVGTEVMSKGAHFKVDKDYMNSGHTRLISENHRLALC